MNIISLTANRKDFRDFKRISSGLGKVVKVVDVSQAVPHYEAKMAIDGKGYILGKNEKPYKSVPEYIKCESGLYRFAWLEIERFRYCDDVDIVVIINASNRLSTELKEDYGLLQITISDAVTRNTGQDLIFPSDSLDTKVQCLFEVLST